MIALHRTTGPPPNLRLQRYRIAGPAAVVLLAVACACAVGVSRVRYECYDPSLTSITRLAQGGAEPAAALAAAVASCGWRCERRSRNLETVCHWCSDPGPGFLSSCTVYVYGVGVNDPDTCGMAARGVSCEDCLFQPWAALPLPRYNPCRPANTTVVNGTAVEAFTAYDGSWRSVPDAAVSGLSVLLLTCCAAAAAAIQWAHYGKLPVWAVAALRAVSTVLSTACCVCCPCCWWCCCRRQSAPARAGAGAGATGSGAGQAATVRDASAPGRSLEYVTVASSSAEDAAARHRGSSGLAARE